MIEKSAFHNAVRSLYNIDRHMLPELTDKQWVKFRDDPPRYFIEADRAQSHAIWDEVRKRQVRT